MLKKLFVIFAVLCSVATFVLASTPRDVGSYLLNQKGAAIFTLTPTDRENTGCTAFNIRVPSGRILTVSNAHCAAMAIDGKVALHDRSGAKQIVKLLKVSDTTDLSIYDGFEGHPALEVASYVDVFEHINVVGHPLLEPNTYEGGYIVARQITKLVDEEATTCNDAKHWPETINGLFGSMTVCVVHIDSWSTSLLIFGGNSGSPVMNDYGHVIGVAFASNTRTNKGSIIPLDVLKSFISVF